jgi:hypothetical protein
MEPFSAPSRPPPDDRISLRTGDDDRVTYDLNDLTRTVREKIVICACGCWYWTGSTDTSGYAKVKMRGKTIIVHRYVWDWAHPDRPLDGYDETIDHLDCPTRRCVRPDHMQLITRSENSTRANATRWHDRKYTPLGEAIDRRTCDVCQNRKGSHDPSTDGEANGNSVLTEEQVRLILADNQSSDRALAARFEVGRTTIRKIRSGETWSHLDR